MLKVLSGANVDIMTRAEEVHKTYTTAPGHTSKGTYTQNLERVQNGLLGGSVRAPLGVLNS